MFSMLWNVPTATMLISLFVSGCTVHEDREYSCRWYELHPHPSAAGIEQFRALFPGTVVTTTQPGCWDKLETGMTRAMVRALVGERLVERDRDSAILEQCSRPSCDEWHVRLYFEPRNSRDDDDELQAIIVRHVVNRPMRSTDWP